MKDMIDIIYNALSNNQVIAKECGERIKCYTYPENGDTSKPFIIIRPLQPPQDVSYASDKSLSCKFFYQIDVQSHERKKCKEIQRAVNEVMRSQGFTQQSGGLDEYFNETDHYVDARRYLKTTDLYDNNY